MTYVDWVTLGVVGVSILAGLMKGAIRTVFSLAGLALGLFVASKESGALALVLARLVDPRFAHALAFILVFLAIGLVFALLGFLFRKAAETLQLSWLDRLVGGLLGFVRGAVIVGVLVLAVEGFGGLKAARKSPTYPYALRCGWVVLAAIPTDAKHRLHWDVLDRRIPEEIKLLRDSRDVI